MQRLRVHEDLAELTDDLDIITFSGYPNQDVLISRRESSVRPAAAPELITVIDDNIVDLGEWFVGRRAVGEEAGSSPEGTFVDTGDTYKRMAALAIDAITEVDEERAGIEELVEDVQELIGALTKERLRPATALDERVRQAGLVLPEGFRPVLFAQHTAGRLELFPHAWTRIPIESAQKFGQWIIEGRSTLKKKSVWDSST